MHESHGILNRLRVPLRGLAPFVLTLLCGFTVACGPELDLAFDGEDPPDVGDEYEQSEDWGDGKADLIGSWPLLRSGQNNRSVVALQYLLREHGEELSVDGDFGPQSVTAVKSFQRRKSLSADGVVGQATWAALIDGMTISPGDDGSHVRALQYLLLNRYSYSLSVTGVFGDTTETRLRAFQEDRCAEEDGVVGDDTWFALIAQAFGCGGGGAAEILRAHQDGRILLQGRDYEGSSPLDNIEDAAVGQPARRSSRGHYGATRVNLNPAMVSALAQITASYGSFTITSVAGGRHSSSSHHYSGNAFDAGAVRGSLVRGDSAAVRDFMRMCVALGARQVIGPSSSVAGAWSDSNHCDHIHCGDF